MIRKLKLDETLASKVTSYLRDLILIHKTFRKGDKIVEADIAEKLNISRAPVRDALRQLESEGLVISIPRKGTFVTDPSLEAMEEIYDIRFLLECRIYEILIEKDLLNDRDFEKMTQVIDQMGKIVGSALPLEKKLSDFVNKDIEFHQYTWSKAERPLTKKILTDLYHQLKLGMFEDLLHEKDLDSIVENHYRIIRELKEGNINNLMANRAHSLFGRRIDNLKK